MFVLGVGSVARIGEVPEVGPMESLGSIEVCVGERYQMQLYGLRLVGRLWQEGIE